MMCTDEIEQKNVLNSLSNLSVRPHLNSEMTCMNEENGNNVKEKASAHIRQRKRKRDENMEKMSNTRTWRSQIHEASKPYRPHGNNG